MTRDRDRIEWDDLKPLRRKRRDGATPEDLAARKFNMAKAKHKGRNHVSNWRRRLSKQAAEKRERIGNANAKSRARSLIEAVRAYWKGETDEHP